MEYSTLYELWIHTVARLRGEAWPSHLRLLEEEQKAPPEVLRARQLERLRRLLTHAWERVPFYRHRFAKCGLHPMDVRSLDDLAALPVLTRAEVVDAGNSLVADGTSKEDMLENSTGGSTGTPMVFYQDRDYHQWSAAERIRTRAWMGVRPGDKVAYMWGADRDMPRRGALTEKLRRRARHECLLNAFGMDVPRMEAYARLLETWGPDLIVGYAGALAAFARFLLSRTWTVRPRAVQSSAETLTPEDRADTERAFGCDVYDFYGSREANNLACECARHQGLHILATNRIVEVVDSGRPCPAGAAGLVTVTVLNSYSMPLIRYQNDDVAVLGEEGCSCGLTLPLLRRLMGRRSDFVVADDGTLIHGEYFTHLFYGQRWARQFQLRQARDRSLCLLIVPNHASVERDISRVAEAVRKAVGAGATLQVRLVDAIPTGPTGKHRFVMSEVPTGFGAARVTACPQEAVGAPATCTGLACSQDACSQGDPWTGMRR